MLNDKSLGRLFGHVCGIVGVMIGVDPLLAVLFVRYVRLFPYADFVSAALSALLIAFGAYLVRENLPRRRPWGGV